MLCSAGCPYPGEGASLVQKSEWMYVCLHEIDSPLLADAALTMADAVRAHTYACSQAGGCRLAGAELQE